MNGPGGVGRRHEESGLGRVRSTTRRERVSSTLPRPLSSCHRPTRAVAAIMNNAGEYTCGMAEPPAAYWIEALGLAPHPEGGYYK